MMATINETKLNMDTQEQKTLSWSSISSSSSSSLTTTTSVTDDLTNLAWLQDSNLLNKLCFNKISSLTLNHRNGHFFCGHHRNQFDQVDVNDVEGNEIGEYKPPYSYSTLIFMAIESSPHKAMMVSDIYKWLINNFPYFATAPSGDYSSYDLSQHLQLCLTFWLSF